MTLRHRVRTSGRSSDLYYNTCSLASRHVCSRRAREGGSVRTAAAMSGRIRREGGGTGVHVLAIVMGQRRQTLLACAHGPLGSLLRAQRGSVSRFANRKSARASSGEPLCTASRMTRLSTNWQPMLAARMTESLPQPGCPSVAAAPVSRPGTVQLFLETLAARSGQAPQSQRAVARSGHRRRHRQAVALTVGGYVSGGCSAPASRLTTFASFHFLKKGHVPRG